MRKPLRSCCRRALLLPVFLLAALAWALPADATLAVDFDGDGTVDDLAVVKSSTSPAEAVITLSASVARHVLRLRDAPLAIVATDVNHDGAPDVSAVSARHGLEVWLNAGRRGFERLRARRPSAVPRVTPS